MFSFVQMNRVLQGWISFLAVFSALLASVAFAEDKKSDSEQMMCPMMAGLSDLELHADSPDALLSRAKELQLEESQVERLIEIQQKARKRARKVLTAKQRESLGEVSEEPITMTQLAHMRVKQEGKKGGQSKEKMCPWCMKSMDRKAESEKKRGSWKKGGWAKTEGKEVGKEEKKESCDCPCCSAKKQAAASKQIQTQNDQGAKKDCECSGTGKKTGTEDEAELSGVAEATSKPTTE